MLVSTPARVERTRLHQPDTLSEPLSMWVHSGALHLTVGDEPSVRVGAGSGVRLPPGTSHDFWTDPDTLMLPLWGLEPISGGREGIKFFETHTTRSQALIDHYSRQGFVHQPELASAPSKTATAGAALLPSPPPLPQFGPSTRVANKLRTHPALDLSLEEWARWVACSPNTLRRSFLAQTGITFSQWRQQSRLARAAELLSDGLSVGHVAAETGYASRWGFTNAFRAQFGMSPRDMIAHPASTPTASQPPHLVQDEQTEATEKTEALRENEMVWIRDGDLHARFDDRLWIGKQGDVMWLPAGSLVEQAPRSAVSLSTLCTDCVQLKQPQRARFSRTWDQWLLWASVSTSTLARPARLHGCHPRLERPLHSHVIDAFETQLSIERARTVRMPDHAAARAAAMHFLRTLGTSAVSTHHDLPADARAAFHHDTGLSFAQWRLAARMRLARTLLQKGLPAGAVSTRVGYTMLCNFSRAFTRFHTIGPREFQALEQLHDYPL